MKNIRVKVRKISCVKWYDFGIYEGRKKLLGAWPKDWQTENGAIKAAKAMAKRIGIPFDPEIVQQHGC